MIVGYGVIKSNVGVYLGGVGSGAALRYAPATIILGLLSYAEVSEDSA